MIKKIGILTLIVSILFLDCVVVHAEEIKSPEVSSRNAVIIDTYDNEVIFEKGMDEQVYPASITKILTALIVEEELADDAIITASENAILEEPSNQLFLLEEGEEITKRDGLHLIMMISSNDVSYALAEAVAGSVEDFAKLMNKRAEELGATNSNFVNPNGLPNENHKTTAYDMALIGKEILKHPNILEAMRADEIDVKTNKREVTVPRTNDIFKNNEYAIGGKTGWTLSSGNTLVEMLQKDGKEIVVVVLGAESSTAAYEDINVLADYGFDQIDTATVFEKDEVVTVIEKNDKQIELLAKEPVTITLKGRKNIDNRVRINEIENYQSGETIGVLEILDENKKVEKTYELYADENIQIVEEEVKDTVGIVEKVKESEDLPKVLLSVMAIPAFIFVLLVGVNMVIRKTKARFN